MLTTLDKTTCKRFHYAISSNSLFFS